MNKKISNVCSYTLITSKEYQDCHCDALGEAIQPIEKTKHAKQNKGLIQKNLFPYFPISLFP